MIVKNFNVPKSCSDCPICHPKGKDEPWNFCCFVEMKDVDVNEFDATRPYWCPLEDEVN